jgi:catechol 2,3-dioxygenase-like lactoylglutathione lyase family enzyme
VFGTTLLDEVSPMTVETHELRIALTVDDFEAAVAFYGALLGLDLAMQWDQPAGKGGVFVVPKATLEILDREMAAGVDDFEVGSLVSGPVRLALGVADTDATIAASVAAGARLVGPAQSAPWETGSRASLHRTACS